MRYLLVGGSVNGLNYIAYLLITWLGVSPRIAVTVLLPLSLLAAFQGHARLTFPSGRRDAGAARRYVVTTLVGYLLNILLLTVLVEGLGILHQLAQFIALATIVPIMFVTLRSRVFTARL